MTALLSGEAPVRALPTRRHLSLVPLEAPVSAPKVSPRIYARRRFAALLVLLIIGGGALLAGKALASANAGATSVTVKQGETLSDVAHEKLPNLPLADAIAKFQRINDLNSMHVDAGEKLLVPAA